MRAAHRHGCTQAIIHGGETKTMNWKSLSILIIAVSLPGIFAACQTAQYVIEEDEPMTEPRPLPEPALDPLPLRSGSPVQTSGSVPHVQIGVEPVPAVNDELLRRAFALPDVENRPTIVSLPGTRGMWLSDGVPLANPDGIVSGREFAHIHPDGSLHAPLPFERALEAAEKGWAERHPWADQRDGWEGLVMLFTPQSMTEMDVTFQLIVESYNHVTGRTVQASDFQ
jgi:hypothetical protein